MPRNIAKYQLLTDYHCGIDIVWSSCKQQKHPKKDSKTGDTNIPVHYLRSTPKADTGVMNLANLRCVHGYQCHLELDQLCNTKIRYGKFRYPMLSTSISTCSTK